jgi:hypothetical protein
LGALIWSTIPIAAAIIRPRETIPAAKANKKPQSGDFPRSGMVNADILVEIPGKL